MMYCCRYTIAMINQELISFLKKELSLGKNQEQIKAELLSQGGWNGSDIEEGFARVANENKKHSGKGVLFLVVIIIALLVGAGVYYAKTYRSSNNPISHTDGVQENAQFIHTNNIKILYPLIGTKIETGASLVVQYEVLNDIPLNPNLPDGTPQVVILLSDKCGDSFISKTKGVYTFTCDNIGTNQVGPLKIHIVEGARSAQEQSVIASGQIQIVSSSNSKPQEIIPGGSVSFDGSLIVYVPVGGESDENVAASSLNPKVKFSDGVTRSVPFTDFTYSFDDATLVRFYPSNAKTPVFIGNKIGQTILHLEYQGVKKDILIKTMSDATTPEDPSTYQKVYNINATSLSDFRTMCKQKNGTLQENPNELTCTSASGNYFISVKGH